MSDSTIETRFGRACRRLLHGFLLVGAAGGLALGVGSPAAGKTAQPQAGGVSGSFGDRQDAFLGFTITGGNLKLRPGSDHSYEGTWNGGPITLSGEMVVTRAPGYISYVRMSAHVGDKSWPGWPPKGNDGAVRGTTVSQHFNLSFTVPPKYTSTWVSGSAALSVCGGICAGYAIDFTIRVDKKVAPPKPEPTGKPKVQAFAPGGGPAEPGGPVTLPYSVSDASGKATVHLQLFQDGAPVGAQRSLPGPATGARQSYTYTRLARTLTGPLFFCVWAESKGGKSDDAPKSSCAWVPFLVDVKSYGVSNGCGGKGWDSMVAIENYFGNTHVYKDAETGVRYTVDFKPACDLHDAGYAGLLVADRINGGGNVDYRSWSRMAVDSKFLRDMRTLCHTAATPAIPPASDAMGQCEHSNMPSSIGAGTLYGFVDSYGDLFFDADLTKPDPQELGDRKARPTGGSRDNGPPKCSASGLVGLVHRRASTRCSGGAAPPTTTTPTPTTGGTDHDAPTLLVQGWSGSRGRPVVLRWRAKDASGRVSFVVEVFEAEGGKAGARVYSKTLSNQPVSPGKYTFFTDSGWKPGAKTWYRLSVQATDPSGNTTKQWATIKVA